MSTGKLVRPHPRIYAVPSAAAKWQVRLEAGLSARQAVASHGTALAVYGLIAPPAGPLHLTVQRGRSVRGSSDVVLHRVGHLASERRRWNGVPITSAARAVVDTWGNPGTVARTAVRAAAIMAVRDRLCRPDDLAAELARRPQLSGRAELAHLIKLLIEGCQSELEIWGCLHILRGPGMPTFVHQRQLIVRGEVFILDAACEESMLAVEFDGAAWHGSKQQRERDIRRDALVATVGWQTLRFGYGRATEAANACRRDILAVHEARLRLMRGGRVR
jgi:very-short-patch-repair endonuclease